MYRLICVFFASFVFFSPLVFSNPSQVNVQKTLPVFLGYTNSRAGTSAIIQNLQEFDRTLGFPDSYQTGTPSSDEVDFLLVHSLEMFWKNGGEKVQVISIGKYDQEGSQKKAAHFIKGLQKLASYPEPQLVLMPEAILLPEAEYGQVCQEALLHAKKYKRFALLDVQSISGENTRDAGKRFRALLAGPNLKEGAAYWPYVKLVDGPWIGPSGLVAGRIAAYDKTKGVWKAPAGVEAVFAQQIQFSPTQAEIASLQDASNGASINSLRKLPGKGIVIWGARTLAGQDAAWRYVSVRRFALTLDRKAQAILQAHKTSPNTAATWTQVKTEIEQIMMDYFRKGAFPASKSSSAYFVKIGLGETMTQKDIDEGNMILELGFAPLKPAEFVVLKMSR